MPTDLTFPRETQPDIKMRVEVASFSPFSPWSVLRQVRLPLKWQEEVAVEAADTVTCSLTR
jgi:hypothetical protein